MGRKSKLDSLPTEEVEYIKVIHESELSHKEKVSILSKKFKVTGRTIRNWWAKLGLTYNPLKYSKDLLEAMERELDEDTDVILVTYAQNKTVVNENMLKSMEAWRDFYTEEGHKAQIVIIPGRYRNPTSTAEHRKSKSGEWWMPEVKDYLFYNKIEFGDTLISTDTRVRPTAKMPLTGFEAMVGDTNLVLGHPRIHLKTMPRFRGDELRTMNTTGAITYKNYSDSKAGDIGYIHHSYGFTVVEKTKDDPERCHPPRPVKVNTDGSFTDLGYEVNGDRIKKIRSSEAMVWGDIHLRNLDTRKYAASMEMAKRFNPARHVMHDIYDGSTTNPHEKDDMYIKKKKIRYGEADVREEIDEVKTFIKRFLDGSKSDLIVVQSNHDDFIDRWVNKHNWKRDLHNSDIYLELAHMQQTNDIEEYGNLLGFILCREFKDRVEYIPENSSLKVEGYQVGKHLHQGVNGARGSAYSFKRMNTKLIGGHSHSPMIIDGVTYVGVSANLWQRYNSGGASSWAHADSVIYSNGKNQLIIYGDDYQVTRLFDV